MRIGVFYGNAEDFQSGKFSRIGVVDKWGQWVGELPPKVAAYVQEHPHCFDEVPGDDLPEIVKELVPDIALETAEICDDCDEAKTCHCDLERYNRRRGTP